MKVKFIAKIAIVLLTVSLAHAHVENCQGPYIKEDFS